MKSASDTSKRPVNLSISARTVDLAKELGMNLSQTVDSFLTAGGPAPLLGALE